MFLADKWGWIALGAAYLIAAVAIWIAIERAEEHDDWE